MHAFDMFGHIYFACSCLSLVKTSITSSLCLKNDELGIKGREITTNTLVITLMPTENIYVLLKI